MTRPSPAADSFTGNPLTALAAFIASSPKIDSAFALERARDALKDTIGCMVFGHGSPEATIARATVAEWGQGPCVVVGGDQNLPAPWAAFVNATAAHALDYDDWDDPSLTHTSAVLLPVVLAAMAERGGSGSDLITSYLIGVETILRLGEALNPSHYWKGWHSTATVGAIGAAASAAHTYGLSEAQTANALSLSTSMAGGFVSQFGAMAKPMHAGLAAKAGLMAASLARNGATGTPTVLDGPISFRTILSDAQEGAFDRPFRKLGKPWAIEEHGLHFKQYPSCGGTHRIIDASLQIVSEHTPNPADIETIVLNVPAFVKDLVPYQVPNTRNEALFSIPYCAAVALATGQAGIDAFLEDMIADPLVRDLTARTRVQTREFEYVSKLCVPGDYDTVTVQMKSGQVYHARVDIPLGAPPKLAPSELVDRKFLDCVRRGLTEERANSLLAVLSKAPNSWSYETLLTQLKP